MFRHLVTLVVLLSLTISHVVYAQPDELIYRNIAFGVGAKHCRFMDEAYSHERVKYNGTLFSFNLNHQRRTDKYFFHVEGQLSYGKASSISQKSNPDVIYFQLNSSYARNIYTYKFLGKSNKLYAGVQLATTNYIINELEIQEEATISSYHTFNLVFFQSTTLSSSNQIEFMLALPLAGFVKRSQYDGAANQDFKKRYNDGVISLLTAQSKFHFISPLALPQLAITFIHGITPKTDVIFGYQFAYLTNTDIAPIKFYSSALTVGLRFNFDKNL